jgi:hypothetical protein
MCRKRGDRGEGSFSHFGPFIRDRGAFVLARRCLGLGLWWAEMGLGILCLAYTGR